MAIKKSSPVLIPFSKFILKSIIFFTVFFLFNSNIFSQEIITDRPDQTESAITVPINSLQIETGFLYEGLKETQFIPLSGEVEYILDNYSAGTLLRYGILENIELRLGGDYLISQTSGSSSNGFGDFLFGTKINFFNEDDEDFLDMGIMIHTSLPFGDKLFSSDEFEPEIIAALSKSLSEIFTFSINLGGNSSNESMNLIYTTALGVAFSDEIGFFAEVFGNIPADNPIHFIDGGFTYLFSENVQIDLSGGKGLSGIDSYWFIGTGISVRVDNL